VSALRETRSVSGIDAAIAAAPSGLDVGGRTPSGRVGELVVTGAGRTHTVRGQNVIRQTLRPPAGGILRITPFVVQVSRTGGRISRLAISGGGNGHGVGMCPWGAVGRARAGFSYRDILSTYFPGTEIHRLY
jgi:stage II sporulation protein D